MLDKLHDIIAGIPSDATIYISNFMPKYLFEKLREKGFTIKLLPSTLKGLIDTKALKTFTPHDTVHIIHYPFFHDTSSFDLLNRLQDSHNFTLHTLLPDKKYSLQTIQKVFQEGLKSSKDLMLGGITTAKTYPIFLAPYMFCPKDEIIKSLLQKGVSLDTNLNGLYQDPYFDTIKKEHLIAHECSLSFIALDCDISPKQADANVKAILDTLDEHALRRCSF